MSSVEFCNLITSLVKLMMLVWPLRVVNLWFLNLISPRSVNRKESQPFTLHASLPDAFKWSYYNWIDFLQWQKLKVNKAFLITVTVLFIYKEIANSLCWKYVLQNFSLLKRILSLQSNSLHLQFCVLFYSLSKTI